MIDFLKYMWEDLEGRLIFSVLAALLVVLSASGWWAFGIGWLIGTWVGSLLGTGLAVGIVLTVRRFL